MTLIRKIFTLCICLLLALQLPLAALAIEVDNSYGDVTIGDTHVDHFDANGAQNSAHGGSVTVVHGAGDQNGTVTVTAGSEEAPADVSVTIATGTDTTVILNDAHLDTNGAGNGIGAALDIAADGNNNGTSATVELNGENTLHSSMVSACGQAGLQVNQGNSVIIQDQNGDGGSLTATGSTDAAGIGSEDNYLNGVTSSGSITINSGNVTAKGGDKSAGIGGGLCASGSDITINGGTVTATGGNDGAGIGGGRFGDGNKITITGGTVTADGGLDGAGIGGGWRGNGSDITISGDAQVTNKVNGSLVDIDEAVDTSGLYTTGSVNGQAGTVSPLPSIDSGSGSASMEENPAPATPFVLNRAYTQTRQDGVLTLTVKGEDAMLTIKTWGMEQLIAQGIHTLILVTDKAETALDLNELLENPGTYVLKHKGTETTLTRGGEIVK